MIPATPAGTPAATPTATLQPEPPRLLTVCLLGEPGSLFLYADDSQAARSVRQAIYDGPFDVRGFALQPVILQDIPSLNSAGAAEYGAAEYGARIEPVQVNSGNLIVDSAGKLVNLGEGVAYLPAGCEQAGCAQVFTGSEVIAMDQLVVRFRLVAGLEWSDGQPLRASDSVYSFQLARELYPGVRPDLIQHTQSYLALDEITLEWRGLPGYRESLYQDNFFTPLPEHAWRQLSPAELLSAEVSTRKPIGWGAYQIEEWTPGDHITLAVNPRYFRLAEGLPRFERLVYRFVSGAAEGLQALLAGECDLLDEMSWSAAPVQELLALQERGSLKLEFEPGGAWEQAAFGVKPGDPARLNLFALAETRQAVALCLDRQRIAESLYAEHAEVPHTYVSSSHPLFNPEAPQYGYDPQAAADLLASIGWLDSDGDAYTPRVATGVPGLPDGTSFEFTYLTLPDEGRRRAAEMVQADLAACGLQANLVFMEREELFTPGPQGPIFGRQFDMAQFAWVASLEPPCSLYTSAEIPGPYPEFPKGWGGGNASGYSSAEFDQACQSAQQRFWDQPEYALAQQQAQLVFSQDLPALPLYAHLGLVVSRPDFCGLSLDPSTPSALWSLEAFDYGPSCQG
ncbi:MAG TPA: ABC transporter substrate-binding protein [Anaerolineales bacterium]|nr:ABC transporter substrate-binding protein [Anaerolineales bacterium]